MPDWLDTFSISGVPGVLGVPPQISAGLRGTPPKIQGVLGVPVSPPQSRDVVHKSLKNPEEHRNTNPVAILRDWHRRLRVLDIYAPPAGMNQQHWAQAVLDAWWIYENFAGLTARDEWNALDLFGVMPAMPGCGGLCDRLRSARNLKMDANRAVWSRWGVRETFCRGGGDDLVASGLVVIWEMGR